VAAPAIASGREREQLKNDQAREQVRSSRLQNQARERQQTALGQLRRGLLDSGPPALMDPQSGGLLAQPEAEQTFRNRQMGVLADIAPEAAAGLLAQQISGPQGPGGRLGDAIATLERIGVPVSMESIDQIMSAGKGGQSPQDLLAQFNLMRGMDEFGREQQERGVQEQVGTVSVNELVNKGQNVIKRARQLEGTFLEPGAFGIQSRRPLQALVAEGAHLMGADRFANARRSEIQAYDNLVKDSTDIVISLTDRFGTNPTNLQTRMLADASAGIGISPAAIVSVTSEMLERTLREADARGQQIEGRAEIEGLLKEYRGLTGGPTIEQEGAAAMGGQIPGFDELLPQEQQELLILLQGGQ
jgi:hypothetical protein